MRVLIEEIYEFVDNFLNDHYLFTFWLAFVTSHCVFRFFRFVYSPRFRGVGVDPCKMKCEDEK